MVVRARRKPVVRAQASTAGLRPDFLVAIAALLGVTVFDTLPGLFVGIRASLLLLVSRASRPYVAVLGKTDGVDGHYRDLARHPDATTTPGVVVLRIESGLYFANADTIRRQIPRRRERRRHPRRRPRRRNHPIHRRQRRTDAHRPQPATALARRQPAHRPRRRPVPRRPPTRRRQPPTPR